MSFEKDTPLKTPRSAAFTHLVNPLPYPLLCSFALLFTLQSTAAPPESFVWKEFRDTSDRSPTRVLPDFSYAGYKHGETGIPAVAGPVFKVTDFGAIPNDSKPDDGAIQSAIDAAEKAGGGVVFFPAGTYLLWTERLGVEPIRIRSSNIVLRGEGAYAGGTVLHFINHGLNAGSYSVPKLGEEFNSLRFLIQAEPRASLTKQPEIKVVEDAPRASFKLKLSNTSGLSPGQWVNLTCKGGPLKEILLAGQSVPQAWEKTTRGLTVTELHQIRSVEGQFIVLHEPLQIPVALASQPTVSVTVMLEEVGIEDIAFRGNWLGKFFHHQTALDDEAWDAILFQYVAHSWIRRCSFLNTNTSVHLKRSAACSLLENRIAGTPGHYCVTVRNGSTWVLQGLSDDMAGQVHGPSVGNYSSGVAAWRWKTKETASFDSHGNMPFATLVDRMDGGTFTRSGGPTSSLPNHLNWLVLWNFDYRGVDEGPIDFWSKASGVAKFVKPWVVGMSGKPVDFAREHLQELESPGVPVAPESLYEAQLALRLGHLPEWVEEAKKDWARVRASPLPVFSTRGQWLPEDKGSVHHTQFQILDLLKDVQIWFSSFEKTPPVNLSTKGSDSLAHMDWPLLHQLLCNAVLAVGAGENTPAEVEVQNATTRIELTIRRIGEISKSKKGGTAADRQESLLELRALAEFLGVGLQLNEAAGVAQLSLP